MERTLIARTLSKRAGLASRLANAASETETTFLIEVEVRRLNRVLEKVARGLYYYELGEPALEMAASVSWSGPTELTPYQLQLPGMESIDGGTSDQLCQESPLSLAVWPEVGSRMLGRLTVGMTDTSLDLWQEVQPKRFKYLVIHGSGPVVVKMDIRDVLSAWVTFEDESSEEPQGILSAYL